MKTFQEFRDEISIEDMAISIGYKYDRRKGKKWPIYVNGDKEKIMIVNPKSSSNQGYRNVLDDTDKGTLIDFIRNRLGKDFPVDASLSEAMNINKALYGFTKEMFPDSLVYRPNEKPPKPFTAEGLIGRLINPRYLFSRSISCDLLLSQAFEGRILNHANGIFVNIAFPYYNIDEQIKGIEKKGYNYNSFVEGSILTDSVWHSNIPCLLEKIVIAESVIDALSYHQLKQPSNVLYVSIGGSLSYDQIKVIKAFKDKTATADNFHFVSAVDNDKAGEMYNKKLKEWLAPDKLLFDKPIGKDYNTDLVEKLVSSQKVKGRRL